MKIPLRRCLAPFGTVWAGRLATLVLAGIFLWAGIAKLTHREDFFNAVDHYRLLSTNMAYRVSRWVPAAEVAVALLVLTPVRPVRRLGLVAYAVMLVFFTGGLLSLWMRGMDVNCGCFGGLGKSHPAWSVLRNVGLLTLIAVAWGRGRTRAPVRMETSGV